MEALRPLADNTGGTFYQFTGEEAPPNIEEYLEPLRFIYQAEYQSSISSSGVHQISLRVEGPTFQANGAEQTITLKVQPPNPIFLSPPAQIERAYSQPSGATDAKASVSALEPNETTIHLMVEFPDGYQRELKAARLYVDGTLAAEVTQPPFDQLRWRLDKYQTSGSHVLQVEVEDELGLSQASIEAPVEVVVERLEIPWWKGLVGERRYQVALATVLAGAVLSIVLVFGGRRKRKEKPSKDPLKQRVPVREEPRSRPRNAIANAQQVTWPRALAHPDAPARLLRLSKSGHSLPAESVALTRKEMTFGRDPKLAVTVLDSPTVSPLHARLYQDPGGRYILVDSGSVAGTWVNYAPVARLGVHLEHGDLIHIGQVAFRFELSNPGTNRKPVVSPYQDEDV